MKPASSAALDSSLPRFDRSQFGRASNQTRARHRMELMDLQKRRLAPAVGIALVGLQLALIGLAGWGGSRALAAWGVTPLSLLALALATFFAGSRFRALGNMIHECSHDTFVSSPEVNRAIGHFLCYVDFADFDAYKAEHGTHHSYLGDLDRDLDLKDRHALFGRRGGSFVLRHLLRPLTLFHLPAYLKPVVWSPNGSRAERIGRAAFLLGLLALAHWGVGWQGFALHYALPYLTAYQVFRYWSDALDHAWITDAPQEMDRARNHVFRQRWLNWLLFPRSDQYHLLHHLFPSLPTGTFREAHERLLASDPEYAARDHSMRWT